jgi:adhesin/invasin
LQSTLTANTTAIPAGGFSTVTLTVQLKDAAGVDLTDNTRTLTFDTPSQGSISAVTVNNDGTYTATYTSGTDVGTVTIVARLDGIAMTQTVVISLET